MFGRLTTVPAVSGPSASTSSATTSKQASSTRSSSTSSLRLTRSLADFAKLVERLDAVGASFVSVTQSFNTATSMGRLTLNVLLSFAQFEWEVTAERIRDKIAASKRRGLWMGDWCPSVTLPTDAR